MEACVIQRDWELQYVQSAHLSHFPIILGRRFAALELQSLKYELEVRGHLLLVLLCDCSVLSQVERARSAAIELKNKQLQAQLEQAGDTASICLPSFTASDRGRRPSIAPSALAPVHVQVRAAARMEHLSYNLMLTGARDGFGWRWRRSQRQQRKGTCNQWTQARQHCSAGA